MKIGFFDSGLGGLIILKAVVKHLPDYDYEFFGDTANVPYGDKTEAEIYDLTKAGVEHLFLRDCALVIIACNTSSAETLRKLQDTILVDKYKDRRILGVIIPTVEAVIDSGVKDVILFATSRTVESQKYNKEFTKFYNNLKLQSKALPMLVPLIEGGALDEAGEVLCTETRLAIESGCKNIILGCTHYSLLKDKVRAVTGVGEVYTQDEIIPQKVAMYLNNHLEIMTQLSLNSIRNIYLSDSSTYYDKIIRQIMGGFIINN